jgi:hypothetical protein
MRTNYTAPDEGFQRTARTFDGSSDSTSIVLVMGTALPSMGWTGRYVSTDRRPLACRIGSSAGCAARAAGGVGQLTAFFTSASIRASLAGVNSFSAYWIGHMASSSRFALSLKPSVAYLVLNFAALWK